ncbi:pyruvoyl-dependent arginine decarboxylase [Candidatus Pyrohabitans sp.]
MRMIPRKVFFTRGVGRHRERLSSFEMALRDAGIEQFNLVRVSSILPPHCEIVPREEGLKELSPGEMAFCVLSENASNEPHRLITASVGCAVPKDRNLYGYLSEHHSFGQSEKEAGEYAEDLAATMLATTLGIDFDPDRDYDERKDIFMMSGKIVKTFNVTQSAVVEQRGKWTTVVAAAVFIL